MFIVLYTKLIYPFKTKIIFLLDKFLIYQMVFETTYLVLGVDNNFKVWIL